MNNYKFDKNFDLITNSIYNLDDNKPEHYETILKHVYDSLSLDYKTLNFFTNQIKIIGDHIFLIGIKFIYYVLNDIKNANNLRIKKNLDNSLNYKNAIENNNSDIDHGNYIYFKICFCFS
jgi:hypothetical protein